MQSVTIDMCNYVNKAEQIKIAFKKFGVIVTMKLDIEIADANKHSSIANNSLENRSEASMSTTSMSIDELGKQNNYLEEANKEYVTLSEALKEEIQQLKEENEKLLSKSDNDTEK